MEHSNGTRDFQHLAGCVGWQQLKLRYLATMDPLHCFRLVKTSADGIDTIVALAAGLAKSIRRPVGLFRQRSCCITSRSEGRDVMANLIGSCAQMFWTCSMGSLCEIFEHSLSDQETALTLILQVQACTCRPSARSNAFTWNRCAFFDAAATIYVAGV